MSTYIQHSFFKAYARIFYVSYVSFSYVAYNILLLINIINKFFVLSGHARLI